MCAANILRGVVIGQRRLANRLFRVLDDIDPDNPDTFLTIIAQVYTYLSRVHSRPVGHVDSSDPFGLESDLSQIPDPEERSNISNADPDENNDNAMHYSDIMPMPLMVKSTIFWRSTA